MSSSLRRAALLRPAVSPVALDLWLGATPDGAADRQGFDRLQRSSPSAHDGTAGPLLWLADGQLAPKSMGFRARLRHVRLVDNGPQWSSLDGALLPDARWLGFVAPRRGTEH